MILTTALIVLAAVIIYRLFPLYSIPGPRLAAVSNIWLAKHVRDGRMFTLGKTLHQKYGPVVRVGPSEVWFNSKEAFKLIYSAGNGFEKSSFYLSTSLAKPTISFSWGHLTPKLEFPDTLDFLSEFDTKRYRLQRRLIGPSYQTSNLKKFQPAIDHVISQATNQLRKLNGAEVDLKEWMHIIAVECLGQVVLSWSPGYIQNKSDGGTGTQAYLGWKRKSVFGLFPAVTAISFFSQTVGRWFSNLWGVTFSTPKGFKPFFTPVYQKSRKRIAAALRNSNQRDDRKDLLADLIQLHKDRPEEFKEVYLRRLAVTNFGAGHETMCSALTSAMAMIGQHLDVQERILQEIRQVDGGLSYEKVVKGDLKYTIASIKEAQRLHPVIGMSLSRTVPSGGMHVHGTYFSAGTTVGCNPVALHRNPDIFGPDADSFNPDRWLQDPESAREMDRYNLTWGGGGRMCPGRHLAELIVYKVVPALVKEFEVEITHMPKEEEMPVYFMAMLTGVKVKFIPWENKLS
ncbi:Pisatin demethylase [Diplogelasinospora grovesii]|uniref:Pisatin demethylase n=1 Tax=Diplogelasinospora grovesii TaxID=303347 RepID=A0AAN6NCE6_9PEZI|nr:Pisatin demethylase [Diplogelasinospora grovesii]